MEKVRRKNVKNEFNSRLAETPLIRRFEMKNEKQKINLWLPANLQLLYSL
jgi:hypothetical protein